MFGNYIKIFFRSIFRNWIYASINVIGLALGFMAFILVGIFLHFETSYENCHSNSERIFRPTYSFNSGSGFQVHWARIPVDYINELPNEFPEVEHLVRLQNHERKYIHINESKFRADNAFIADYEIFEVFDLPLLTGNSKTALREPNSIVLSASLAEKYFGDEPALGREVAVLSDWNNEKVSFKVTGIMEDVPANTHLPMEILFSFSNEDERSGWAYVYILLRKGSDIEDVNAGMARFMEKYASQEQQQKVTYEFQPLEKIHLNSNLAREIIPNSSLGYVRIFMVVGLLIMLIALSNFTNLHIAMMLGRSREVGLRKILGAGNAHIFRFMLTESIFVHLVALLLGILLSVLLFPYFKSLTGIELILHPIQLAVGLFAIAVVFGITAGIYPAILLIKKVPLRSVQQANAYSSGTKEGTFSFKRIMITLQYSISVLLISSAIIARNQFLFLNMTNLGITNDQIVAIPGVPDEVKDGYEGFKLRISEIPGVISVASCMEVPSREIRDSGPVLVKGINFDKDEAPMMDMQLIDHAYTDLMNLKLVAGRNLPWSLTNVETPEIDDDYTWMDFIGDKPRAYLINETAMKQLGWQNPEEALGQEVNWSIGDIELAFGPVVGVLEDYHQETLKNSIDPTIFTYEPIWLRTFLVKIDTDQIQSSIATISSNWEDLFPNYPLEYFFLDDLYEQLYKNERVNIQLLILLSGLAITISMIGLIGLVVYSLKTRMKEIAIRRVLGATTAGMIRLISKEYLVILLVSSTIAIPLSYYILSGWLNQFAYKVAILPDSYLITILSIGILILLATGVQTVRASVTNPAHTLRNE